MAAAASAVAVVAITVAATTASGAAADVAPSSTPGQGLLQSLAADMQEIPAGSYLMGDAEVNFGDADEKPTHRVSVRRFHIARHAVTFEQYDTYSDGSGRARVADEGWGRGLRPVIHVSWNDAQDFLRWLNEHGGQHYRLPTEAEWEYAARAGSKGHFPWGEHFEAGVVNSAGTTGADRFEFTAPVGSFPANAWSLFDMLGNVEQWVADCYRESYTAAPANGAAVEDEHCAQRVRRGGSWGLAPWFLRVDYRNSAPPAMHSDAIGFRLARDD